MITGFTQCLHSSVQLVLKRGWKYQVKSDLGDNEYPPAIANKERSIIIYGNKKEMGLKDSIQCRKCPV